MHTYYILMAAMFVVAIVVFIALFFFKAGYGYLSTSNWGPKINNKAAWVIMESPAFIFMMLYVVDFLMSWVGAKKFGATWKGALGAFVGAIVGIFIPPPLLWIFIGPLVGAFAFEFLGGAGLKVSTKAGLGAFIGTVLASVFKFIVIVFMALTLGWWRLGGWNDPLPSGRKRSEAGNRPNGGRFLHSTDKVTGIEAASAYVNYGFVYPNYGRCGGRAEE